MTSAIHITLILLGSYMLSATAKVRPRFMFALRKQNNTLRPLDSFFSIPRNRIIEDRLQKTEYKPAMAGTHIVNINVCDSLRINKNAHNTLAIKKKSSIYRKVEAKIVIANNA